ARIGWATPAPCTLRRLLEPPDLPAATFLREHAAHPHLEMHLAATARVLEHIVAREGGQRFVTLEEDVHVRELHLEAVGVLEVAPERVALAVAHGDLDRGKLVEVLRLEGGTVRLEDPAHRRLLRAILLRVGSGGPGEESRRGPTRRRLAPAGPFLLHGEPLERLRQELVGIERLVGALGEDLLRLVGTEHHVEGTYHVDGGMV